MKKMIFLSCMFLITVTGAIAQDEIDSAWIAKTYFPKLLKDVGRKLSDPGDLIDSSGHKISLSAFKGKILYIHVWATNCGACIGNFPHSEQLKKRLAVLGLDTVIQFINVCTDESPEKWKELLKKHHPTGINLYSEHTFKKWNIDVHPAYLVVDANGKILCGNALRPEEGGVDFMLYAASKGITPAEAIWKNYRQYKYYRTNNRYTDDSEGQDYAKWFKTVSPSMVEYFQWKQQRAQSMNKSSNN